MEQRRLNGTAVRVIRMSRGVRAVDLAASARIDPGYLTKLEQGKRQPSPEVLKRLTAALDVPLDAITYLAAVDDLVVAL